MDNKITRETVKEAVSFIRDMASEPVHIEVSGSFALMHQYRIPLNREISNIDLVLSYRFEKPDNLYDSVSRFLDTIKPLTEVEVSECPEDNYLGSFMMKDVKVNLFYGGVVPIGYFWDDSLDFQNIFDIVIAKIKIIESLDMEDLEYKKHKRDLAIIMETL